MERDLRRWCPSFWHAKVCVEVSPDSQVRECHQSLRSPAGLCKESKREAFSRWTQPNWQVLLFMYIYGCVMVQGCSFWLRSSVKRKIGFVIEKICGSHLWGLININVSNIPSGVIFLWISSTQYGVSLSVLNNTQKVHGPRRTNAKRLSILIGLASFLTKTGPHHLSRKTVLTLKSRIQHSVLICFTVFHMDTAGHKRN